MQTRFILQWSTILSFLFVIAFIRTCNLGQLVSNAVPPVCLYFVLLYWVLAIPNKVSIGYYLLINLGFNIRLLHYVHVSVLSA